MTTLKKRTVRPPTSNTEGTYSGSASSNQFQDNRRDSDDRKGDNEREEEDDDKEARLTLMEEVLLLGLKDREVRSMKKPHIQIRIFSFRS